MICPDMPTYAYACADCGHAFDIVQSFSDDALTVCPQCDGTLRKQFNAVGVVFKGGEGPAGEREAPRGTSGGPEERGQVLGESGCGHGPTLGARRAGRGRRQLAVDDAVAVLELVDELELDALEELLDDPDALEEDESLELEDESLGRESLR